MKFILTEDVNKYYRYILYNAETNNYESFFIGLGKYLKKLYNEDSEIWDDFNYSLSRLEYEIEVPELDFKNKQYNFAFTKKAINIFTNKFDDLFWYIDEYSPFKVKIQEISLDDKDIIYRDDLQVAFEI